MDVSLRSGKYLVPGTAEQVGDRIYLTFPYSPELINEIKTMKGPKWHGFEKPPIKAWSVEVCPRNLFNLAYLMGRNPYARYEQPLPDITSERPLLFNQKQLISIGLTYKNVIWAADMGLGKTLSAIELMERVKVSGNWYVGPKSALAAVSREFVKWNSKVSPLFLTYEDLVKLINSWPPGSKAPQLVIFDESSKLKTPTAQRTIAAQHLADSMRKEHGENCYVVLMTGTPSPKSPLDWWSQCEIACPGFIKEGDINKLRKSLAIIVERESISGGVYPEVVSWLDNSDKCALCGKMRDEHIPDSHDFKPSVNQVDRLYRRLKGLVTVQLKKDFLDLPEKRYELVKIAPDIEILRAAKLIAKTAKRAIESLTLLRELSDGFQYKRLETGEEVCPYCNGSGTSLAPEMNGICDVCGGERKVSTFSREVISVPSNKDAAFVEILDNHEEVGRLIVWGGFQATIDKLVNLSQSNGWCVLRCDGRGFHGFTEHNISVDYTEFLSAMDLSSKNYSALLEKYPRLIFVGNPQAGGMGLTLTAAPGMVYFSNSFDGTSRMQSEDRAHRVGMDKQRGLIIYDLIQLPTDLLVLENLKQKRRLQDISLGEISRSLE